MPNLGKETERQLTSDEIALREIEGYLDKVEHQVETQKPQVAQTQAVQIDPATIQPSIAKPQPSQAPVVPPAKILLPLDQVEVETGLGGNVVDGFRWLSEWCVMMIKKYPGRVFYMPPQMNK
jgi:hypothetical protein